MGVEQESSRSKKLRFMRAFHSRQTMRKTRNGSVSRAGKAKEITEQRALLMWLRDPESNDRGLANRELLLPIPIERVTGQGAEQGG